MRVLNAFGLPTNSPDLTEARDFFAAQDLRSHIRRVFDLAGVSEVVMTNDPLDPDEAPLWENNPERDAQFHPVLRLDRILNKWTSHWRILESQGYAVDEGATGESSSEVRRFLEHWMRPHAAGLYGRVPTRYVQVSGRKRSRETVGRGGFAHLPRTGSFTVRHDRRPLSSESMLRLAGDALGRADLRALEHLCSQHPDNRFLCSVLSRENQHELCVYARKFSNLMPFGCWWFLNNPSIVEEMTSERLEMLGTSFIPQHSDARVLEQVIYKWRNTRRTLAPILANKYRLLCEDGRPVTREDMQRDIARLLRGNIQQFAELKYV